MSRPQPLANVEAAPTDLVGEIGDFVRADALFGREQRRGGGSEAAVEDMRFLLDRIFGPSVDEIDRAISELQTMRDVVRNEGERVQREVADYVSMSQTAMASTKLIAEGLAHWRSAMGAA
jgi:hypothetical protein